MSQDPQQVLRQISQDLPLSTTPARTAALAVKRVSKFPGLSALARPIEGQQNTPARVAALESKVVTQYLMQERENGDSDFVDSIDLEASDDLQDEFKPVEQINQDHVEQGEGFVNPADHIEDSVNQVESVDIADSLNQFVSSEQVDVEQDQLNEMASLLLESSNYTKKLEPINFAMESSNLESSKMESRNLEMESSFPNKDTKSENPFLPESDLSNPEQSQLSIFKCDVDSIQPLDLTLEQKDEEFLTSINLDPTPSSSEPEESILDEAAPEYFDSSQSGN